MCRLTRTALRGASWTEASAAATRALALWRAAPMADVPSQPLRAAWLPRLEELRLQALEWRAEAELRLGHFAPLVPELRELTARYALRENLHAALVRALAGAGQRAQALDAYQRARRVLVDELGIEPGPELQAAQREILAADRRPAATAPTVPSPAVPTALPPAPVRQLPAPIGQFAGRTHELTALTAVLDQASSANTVVISAIGGTAGIGKSALALHWAHQVADRFPDGQLYVNLRGFEPSGTPMMVAEAVRLFLGALGVGPAQIPATVDAQIALYRTMLSGKRVLVVLDNARDAEQVRPLLPAGCGCLALVTSRTQLAPLVATEAAHLINLDLLTADEARQLLTQRLGGSRVAADPAATDAIIDRCARLPLALAIAAARAAVQPRRPLAALAAELADSGTGIGALSAGDAATDVCAVFSWSYRTLSPETARLFRLLGLHPGPDMSARAAASLAALPVGCARIALDELVSAQLVTEDSPGRYAGHDLLRAYALDLTRQVDSAAERDAAARRMLDHYLYTAHEAGQAAQLVRDALPLPPRQPGVTLERFDNQEQTTAWFTAEHAVLAAAVEYAAATGLHTHAWQLAWVLGAFLDRRGYWQEQLAAGTTALAAASRQGDAAGQAYGRRLLARALTRLGRRDEAYRQLSHALELYCRMGDRAGQAQIHRNLGQVCERDGRPIDAIRHLRQALNLFQATGQRYGQAQALNAIGWCHILVGDFDNAVACCREALAIQEDLDDREGLAATWDSLGYAYHHVGRYPDAVSCYQASIELQHGLGGRYNKADTLNHLGDTYHVTGDHKAARGAWLDALTILDELHHPDAQRVRAKLR